jgi:hypothetical protein
MVLFPVVSALFDRSVINGFDHGLGTRIFGIFEKLLLGRFRASILYPCFDFRPAPADRTANANGWKELTGGYQSPNGSLTDFQQLANIANLQKLRVAAFA